MGPATYDLASLLRDSYVDLDEDRGQRADRRVPAAQGPGESREAVPRAAST